MGITTTLGPLIKIGNIDSIVEDRVIITPIEKIILDIENFVLTKERKVFGTLEDVFGPIERPFYSVLNDQFVKDLFTDGKVQVGDPVFCLSSAMKELNQDRINELKNLKGCDASNKFDEEPMGPQESEDVFYSDDELDNGSRKKPGQEFIGKRNREMDEEDWTKNKKNKDKVNELKQKYAVQPTQVTQMSDPIHRYSTQPSYPQAQSHPVLLTTPEGFQQIPYGHVYSGYMAPMIPQMTPEQLVSYNQYLAQINMMYGLPPFAHNNYIQPQNPSQSYSPQEQQPHPQTDYYTNQQPNPQ